MYFLDNNSGTPTMPALKTAQSTTPLWFTEGDGSKGISWPGQDWFNIVQAELLAILAAAGIKPEKGKLNQLALSIKATIGTEALLQKNYLSEIAKAGKDAQQKARDNLALGKLATKDSLGPGDVNAYSKQESDGRYFARGTTATTKDVAWNAASGVYNTQADGMTMLVHFAAGGTGSTRAADFRFNYGNGGLAFRSSRDGFGYENGWTKVYTDRQRPTAAEVQAADVRNNFAAKMGANRTLLKDSQPTSAGVWSVEGNTWTPEAWGTLLCTNNRPDLKVDKGNGQFHHYLFLSHSRKLWVATNVNGNWSGWQVMYSTSNKPTAADTGALSLTGGKVSGEIQSTSSDNYRIVAGDYGTFWRNDGNSLYLLLTKAKDPYGTWNNLRPFTVDVKTGQVTFAHFVGVNDSLTVNKYIRVDKNISVGEDLWVDRNATVTGTLKVGNSTHASDGNIMGSRWGNKWLWDAVIEQINGRVDWGTFNREVGARATTDYVRGNFVQDVRFTAERQVGANGVWDYRNGNTVLSGFTNRDGDYSIEGLYWSEIQILKNGQWLTIGRG